VTVYINLFAGSLGAADGATLGYEPAGRPG